jgi:hypothetical protein
VISVKEDGMRRGVVAALAAGIGMAVSFSGGASAHEGYSEYRRDVWYRAYDRIQAARERRRADAESRAEKRALAYQDRLVRLRERALTGRIHDRRWAYEGHRRYRDYENYCDCPSYRAYAEGPRVYGYGYGYPVLHGYGYPYPDLNTDNRQIKDRDWRPESYPTGWSAWWLRMDRDRRGGN